MYNNIHHPSKLLNGADFYCFKHQIEPKWEDPVCANGGKWTITFFNRGKSDTSWLYTVCFRRSLEVNTESKKLFVTSNFLNVLILVAGNDWRAI